MHTCLLPGWRFQARGISAWKAASQSKCRWDKKFWGKVEKKTVDKRHVASKPPRSRSGRRQKKKSHKCFGTSASTVFDVTRRNYFDASWQCLAFVQPAALSRMTRQHTEKQTYTAQWQASSPDKTSNGLQKETKKKYTHSFFSLLLHQHEWLQCVIEHHWRGRVITGMNW